MELPERFDKEWTLHKASTESSRKPDGYIWLLWG